MLSGLQLLDRVDERVRRAESEAAAAQAELDALMAQRDQALSAEAACLRTLAQIRVGALRSGTADLQLLDDADARAQALLVERQTEVTAAEAELATKRPTLAAAERERETRAAALRSVEADAERALAAAHDAVFADPEWQRRRADAESADRVAEHAEHKATFALQDSRTKGEPYMADPLFSYLWRRGFGTPVYRAGFPGRLIDGWVARIARFEPARRDYVMLTELPRQLASHAARMRETAQGAAGEIMERARHIAGLPAAHEVAELQRALDEAEAKLETARADVEAVQSRVSALTAGDDALMQEAVSALQAALRQTSMVSLRAAAARTPTLEDDRVVAALDQANGSRIEAERLIAQRQEGVRVARQQVNELREIRQEMRQRGYSQGRWNFGDGAVVGLLLGEMLRGVLSRGSFWDRLNQQRLPDPWNRGPQNVGRGSFGVWGQPPVFNPGSRVGAGGGARSFGGDSFRTGGQVQGGGFRTGGSI